MRKIKFRAWVPDEGMLEDITTWTDDFTDLLNETVAYHQDHDVILMQFTGLLDKNGEEIYEGDILAFGIKSRDVVRYEDGGFKIEKIYLGAGIKSNLPIGDVEVIGNILQDSHLLETVSKKYRRLW